MVFCYFHHFHRTFCIQKEMCVCSFFVMSQNTRRIRVLFKAIWIHAKHVFKNLFQASHYSFSKAWSMNRMWECFFLFATTTTAVVTFHISAGFFQPQPFNTITHLPTILLFAVAFNFKYFRFGCILDLRQHFCNE